VSVGKLLKVRKSSGVNFTNVLRAALKRADPKSIKRYYQLDLIFMLLGSTHVKTVQTHVGEMNPRWVILT